MDIKTPKQMYKDAQFAVIISKTQLSLWENRVPDIIYKTIKEQSNIKTRKEVENLSRHNCVMINAFCEMYGEYLERCEYATIKVLPIHFRNFYSIIQIPVFCRSLSPETVELKVEESLSFYKYSDVYKEIEQFIRQNSNRCSFCITFRGYIVL